jgi:F-type H+-transporting ATPase subunit a
VSAQPQIRLVAEPVVQIGPISLSNSALLGLVGAVVLGLVLAHTVRRSKSGRHTRLSIGVLWLFEWLLASAEEVTGSREAARQVAPLAVSMFLFLIVNNWLDILPLVGPLEWQGHAAFRGLAADLNFTFALALVSFTAAQVWAIKRRGLFGDIGRYVANPFRRPLAAFEGFLEFVAELSRTTALSLRLFGNIFGGEVLLLVVSYTSGWFSPLTLPVFMAFELFVGAVQAYIFFMLTVTFIALAGPSEAPKRARLVPVTQVSST